MTKRRKKKHTKRWIGLTGCLILVLAFLSVKINTIQIIGNKKYTKEQIEQILFESRWSRITVLCYIQNRFRPHKTIPFVEDYNLVFQSPFEAEVIIYEKSVVGYVSYMSSNMYFDKDGIIVESSTNKLEGIPQITGLTFGQIVLNQPLPVENQQIFERIMQLTQALSVSNISADKIQYNKQGNATLVVGDIDVILGDNQDIDGKISRLNNMLPELAGLAGTLYLDTYDENNSDKWYSFIKK